jgi:hypothetical protein
LVDDFSRQVAYYDKQSAWRLLVRRATWNFYKVSWSRPNRSEIDDCQSRYFRYFSIVPTEHFSTKFFKMIAAPKNTFQPSF